MLSFYTMFDFIPFTLNFISIWPLSLSTCFTRGWVWLFRQVSWGCFSFEVVVWRFSDVVSGNEEDILDFVFFCLVVLILHLGLIRPLIVWVFFVLMNINPDHWRCRNHFIFVSDWNDLLVFHWIHETVLCIFLALFLIFCGWRFCGLDFGSLNFNLTKIFELCLVEAKIQNSTLSVCLFVWDAFFKPDRSYPNSNVWLTKLYSCRLHGFNINKSGTLSSR